MISPRVYKRFYPDTRRSGTLFFYAWMQRSLAAPYRALNLGAGPGDSPESELFRIRDMRRSGGTVEGCDPDPIVVNNVQIDRAVVMEDPNVIPFENGTMDIVYSDYVLEHVECPEAFLREVYRVLKPGGSFMFRTPNSWHYVSIAARLTPQWVHLLVANKVRGLGKEAHEPYRTWHRMNSRRTIEGLFAAVGFRRLELVMFEGEPSYLMFSNVAFVAGGVYERIVNAFPRLAGLRANIIGRGLK